MGGIQGRTTPDFSKRPEEQPLAKTDASSDGMTVQKDTEGSIEIKPAAVGDEKTLQLAIVCLTLIAICVMSLNAYTHTSGNVETIVVPIITGIAGLLGGQALRK